MIELDRVGQRDGHDGTVVVTRLIGLSWDDAELCH